MVRNQSTVVETTEKEIRRLITSARSNQFCRVHGIRKIWRSHGGARTEIKAERYSRVKVTLVLTNTGYDFSTWRALNCSGLPTSADSRSSLSPSYSFSFSLSLLSLASSWERAGCLQSSGISRTSAHANYSQLKGPACYIHCEYPVISTSRTGSIMPSSRRTRYR